MSRNTVLRVRIVVLLTVAALCAAAAAPAAAQSVDVSADAPAAPIAPDVITRDDDGRATIRAVRVTQPLRIDGALDERSEEHTSELQSHSSIACAVVWLE